MVEHARLKEKRLWLESRVSELEISEMQQF